MEVDSGLNKRVANWSSHLPSTAKCSTTTQKSATLRPHQSVAPRLCPALRSQGFFHGEEGY